MLTEKELQFIAHWEKVREMESKTMSKFMRGLPMALLFGLPILASVVLVYALSPEWYTKISQDLKSVTVTILIGVLLAVIFFSFTRMHFKWEMNEQLYQELKVKQAQSKTNAA